MGVTVAEVSAVLTARNEMSAALKTAQQDVKDLEDAFVKFGGTTGARLPQVERELASARTKVEELKTSMGSAAGGAEEFSGKMTTAGGTMEQMDRIATRMIERMAIMFALKGTEQFIANLFTAAEKTANLATNLDLSTDKVQEFDYAARQTGVSIGTLTSAVDNLGRKLATGGDSVGNALDTLGLNTDAFFNADPGEKFDQVAREIALMGDKTARTGEEMALFGTDKLDPVIMKLGQLQQAAHDAGVVLAEEDVKALDAAKKSMETTVTQLEVLASKWLVAAQNAVAYAGAVALIGIGPKEFDAMANGDLDPSKFLPAIHGKPDALAVGAGPGESHSFLGQNVLDPSKAKELSVIATIEKEITEQVHQQYEWAKQEEALTKVMVHERLRVNKEITAEIHKQIEAMAKATDTVVVANLNAGIRNNAAMGLDAYGDPQRKNDPFQTYANTKRDIGIMQGQAPGADVSQLLIEASRVFQESVLADAKAADAEVQARAMAARSAEQLAAATDEATRASNANRSYAIPTKNMFPTSESLDRAIGPQSILGHFTQNDFPNARVPLPKYFETGGPTGDGGPAVLHAGEYVVPKGGALVSGGGSTTVQVTVQGNVYTMDPSGKAAFSQAINEAVTAALRQGRPLPRA